MNKKILHICGGFVVAFLGFLSLSHAGNVCPCLPGKRYSPVVISPPTSNVPVPEKNYDIDTGMNGVDNLEVNYDDDTCQITFAQEGKRDEFSNLELEEATDVEYHKQRKLFYYTEEILNKGYINVDDTVDDTYVFSLDTSKIVQCAKSSVESHSLQEELEENIYDALLPLNKKILNFPYIAHGCLMISEGSNRYIASGVLIDEDHVLTAAHNVIDETSSRLADVMTFHVARHNSETQAILKIEKVALSREYYNAMRPQNRKSGQKSKIIPKDQDLAILKIFREKPDTPALTLKKQLEINSYSLEELLKVIPAKVEIIGYRGDRPLVGGYMSSEVVSLREEDKNADNREAVSLREEDKNTDNRLEYSNAFTVIGQSGAGVWANLNGQKTLIGIHSRVRPKIAKGYAVVIDKEKREVIKKWQSILADNIS